MKTQRQAFIGWLIFFMVVCFGMFCCYKVAHGQTLTAKADKPAESVVPVAPVIPIELELAFANADRELAYAQAAIKELTTKRDEAAKALMDQCKAPWALSRDSQTQRFKCVEAPKPDPPKK